MALLGRCMRTNGTWCFGLSKAETVGGLYSDKARNRVLYTRKVACEALVVKSAHDELRRISLMQLLILRDE
jgi:hypothetical protein